MKASVSLDVVMQMLRIAYQRGTRVLVATPHMFLPPYNNNDVVAVNACFAKTIEELRRRSRIPGNHFLQDLKLHLGSENYLSSEFLQALEKRLVLTLGGSRYVLVEFRSYLSFEMLVSAAERIATTGLVPVLAHVERYAPFLERPDRLAELVRSGCIAQLNSTCLLRSAARSRRKIALSLLRQGLVHVIASDAHESHRRTPDLRSVFDFLSEKFPQDRIQSWMYDNPNRILNNQDLD